VKLRSALVGIVFLVAGAARAHGDKVGDLSHALTSDPDFKVRLTAAVVLGKLRDPRSEPALIQGLADSNETVRGMSAAALGNIGDAAAIPPLERVATDRSDFVRARAVEALNLLRPQAAPPPSPPAVIEAAMVKPPPRGKGHLIPVALGTVHNKTHHGGPGITGRLRETLVKQISEWPNFALGPPMENGYEIDSSIDELSRKTVDHFVEISCEVTLIVNKHGHGIAGRASGGATVQVPRLSFSPAREEAYQIEALENAVRGAHPNLIELISGLQAGK
jgi:hypothetical protein